MIHEIQRIVPDVAMVFEVAPNLFDVVLGNDRTRQGYSIAESVSSTRADYLAVAFAWGARIRVIPSGHLAVARVRL